MMRHACNAVLTRAEDACMHACMHACMRAAERSWVLSKPGDQLWMYTHTRIDTKRLPCRLQHINYRDCLVFKITIAKICYCLLLMCIITGLVKILVRET